MSIRVVEVDGDEYRCGVIIGRSCAELVDATLDAYGTRLERWAGIGRREYPAVANEVESELSQRTPALLDYLRGVAEGGHQPLPRLLTCLAAYDLWLPNACTSVASVNQRGELWLAQTFDWFVDQRGQLVWVRRLDARGATVALTLCEAGFPCLAGLNHHGVGVLVNGVTARRRRSGLPARAAIWKALRATSLEHFRGEMAPLRCMSAAHVLAGTGDGELAAAELSPEGNVLACPRARHMTHTNHFLYGSHLEAREGLSAVDVEESAARRQRVEQWIEQYGEPADYPEDTPLDGDPQERHHPVSRFHELFSQHDETWFPRTVCCHAHSDFDPLQNSATLTALVMHPATRRIWTCSDNPCVGRFEALAWSTTDARSATGGVRDDARGAGPW